MVLASGIVDRGSILLMRTQGNAAPLKVCVERHQIEFLHEIERRPLLLVEATAGKTKVSLVLQNAETIRLVREDGSAISVVQLAPGDKIMGCALEGGRHFGMAIKETIREK